MGDGTGARPQAHSELRLRVNGVEIAVEGESREDCLRRLERAVQELEREGQDGKSIRLTPTGAAYLEGLRDGQRGAVV